MNKQVHDEAADFFVELRSDEVSVATSNAFDAWLRASPEHIRAYLQILPGWDAAQHLSAHSVERLVELARADANVVSLRGRGGSERNTDVAPGRNRRRRAYQWAGAAALAALAVGGVAIHRTNTPAYATKVGELLTLRLADGSTIDLNTETEIRVEFSRRARSVELVRGQALFRVARDGRRPFVVATTDTQVRALGTAFDVRRREANTVVTVVEGKVAVSENPSWIGRFSFSSDARESGGSVLLAANQKTVATSTSIGPPTSLDASVAIAWTQRRLVFDAAPLSEVIAEFNRYGKQKIEVSAALADLSITATFGSTDPASLVAFLETLPDVQVVRADEATRIRKRVD